MDIEVQKHSNGYCLYFLGHPTDVTLYLSDKEYQELKKLINEEE